MNQSVLDWTYLFSAMSISPLARINNVGEFGVGISWDGTGALADDADHLLGVELKVLKADQEAGIICLKVLTVPGRPVMRQGLVMDWWVVVDFDFYVIRGEVGFGQAHVVGVRHQIWTVTSRMGPLGGVGVFAHGLHPGIGVADNGNWKDVGLVDLVIMTGRVGPLTRGQGVFAPGNLPTGPSVTIVGIVWHQTVGFNVHGKRVGSSVEHS